MTNLRPIRGQQVYNSLAFLNNMDRREELVELCGQIINGIMSSDSSLMTKILDRSLHSGAASATVGLAIKIQEKIDEHFVTINGITK